MSEKKSNGQVPEEGPDGKNLEQSEKKESFAFLEETIKPKKISKQQGMKQLIRIAICGLVLGGFACLGFFCILYPDGMPGILCIAPACTAFIS